MDETCEKDQRREIKESLDDRRDKYGLDEVNNAPQLDNREEKDISIFDYNFSKDSFAIYPNQIQNSTSL